MRATTLIACVLGVGAFVIIATLVYPPEQAFAAVLFGSAVIAAISVASPTLGVLSWSAGVPIFYGVFFLILPMLAALALDQPEDATIVNGLYVATAGMVSFVFGLLVMRLSRGPRPSYDLFGILSWDLPRERLTIATLILIGAAALLWSFAFGYFGLNVTELDGQSAAAGPISTATWLLTFGLVMAWNAYFKSGRLLFLALLATLVMMGFGVLSNSKSQMISPLLLIALTYWGVSGRFPFKMFACGVLLYAFVVFPFVTASRFSALAGIDRADLVSFMWDYLWSMNWTDDAAGHSAIATLDRGLLTYFSEIVERTGTSVYYLGGRTLIEGLEAMVPRFIYPSKVNLEMANWTAHYYGVIGLYDDTTNVAPTYMGEFYMNFGLAGLCIGMFLIGVLAVLFDRYAIVRRDSWTMPIMIQALMMNESFVGQSLLPFAKVVILCIPILLFVKFITGSPVYGRRSPAPR
jgi:hypothetical protein